MGAPVRPPCVRGVKWPELWKLEADEHNGSGRCRTSLVPDCAERAPGELVAPLPPEPQTPNVEEIAAEGLRWIKIDQPGALEQAWLEENFDFHALDYEDVLSRNQRPKIDVYDDYLFIVLQFPIFDRSAGALAPGSSTSSSARTS